MQQYFIYALYIIVFLGYIALERTRDKLHKTLLRNNKQAYGTITRTLNFMQKKLVETDKEIQYFQKEIEHFGHFEDTKILSALATTARLSEIKGYKLALRDIGAQLNVEKPVLDGEKIEKPAEPAYNKHLH